MGVEIRLAREPNPGVAGTLDYVNAGLTEEVKSALFVAGNPTADDTPTTHATLGVGVGNGASTEGSVGTWRRHDVTTSLGRSRSSALQSVDLPGQLASTIVLADFSAFINTGTRGATLNFSTTSPGHVAAALFAGSDLSVANGTFTSSARAGSPLTIRTGLANIDLLLFIGPSGGAFGGIGQPGLNFGACAQELDGTLRQMSVAQATNAVSFVVAEYLSTDRCFTRIDSTGATTHQTLIESISGGDFLYSGHGIATAWFAYDFGGRAQATIRAFASDPADTSVSVATDFAPFFSFVVQTLLQVTDTGVTTVADCGTLSLGMVDAADQFAFGNSALEGAGGRDVCFSYMAPSALVAQAPADGSLVLEATASFGSTSVALSYSTNDNVTERHGFLVAIGTPGDIAQDEVVSVLDDSHAQLTGLLAPDTEVVSVLDDVQAVLSAAELEPQRGTRPKTTARAGVDAAQGARPGADQLGTASSA